MIDVSELINDPDFCITISLLTPDISVATSGEQAGEVVIGTPTVSDLTCIVQPATDAKLLESLPEGERSNDAIRIWSLQQIPEGSFVLYDSRQWKIYGHRDWRLNGYWFCLGVDNQDAKN